MRLEIQAHSITKEALPGGGSYVARLNFKTSRVCVYKCLSLIVGFAVTVAIWPREVDSCHDFILHAVATFWAMALGTLEGPHKTKKPFEVKICKNRSF